MKLLFDENLSHKLPAIMATVFPGSMHVRQCGLKGFPDGDVWKFARDNGFTIVSKDSDFYQYSLLYGAPPKVIRLRIGNCTREDIVKILTAHERTIKDFNDNPIESVIVI